MSVIVQVARVQWNGAARRVVAHYAEPVRLSNNLSATMADPYDHNAFIEAQDTLINLLVQHDEASRAEDWRLLRALERQIETARLRCDELRSPPPS